MGSCCISERTITGDTTTGMCNSPEFPEFDELPAFSEFEELPEDPESVEEGNNFKVSFGINAECDDAALSKAVTISICMCHICTFFGK